MKFLKKMWNALHSRGGAYVFFALSAAAFTFVSSATWAYGWIAELYPLGDKFIPVLLGLIIASALMHVIVMLIHSLKGEKRLSAKGETALGVIHTVFALISVVAFVYGFVLVFSLDKGFTASGFSVGFSAISAKLASLMLCLCLPLSFVFATVPKKAAQGAVASVLIAAIFLSVVSVGTVNFDNSADKLPKITFKSENLMAGAKIVYETLADSEDADAANLLTDGNECWTAQHPEAGPNNSFVEIRLSGEKTFNTAVIEEVGNQAQYFRLQAFVDGDWQTVYRSEKIQSMRICSFDAVTTDTIRLSIDKFRDDGTPVKIKSIKLYNEPARDAENFEVTAYQRLDGDVPTEVLAKGEEYVKNYARYYDVYSTIIVFSAIVWTEDGKLGFREGGEEEFARQLEALKKIISYRSNKEHEVKIIVTTLSDGTWDEIGVNGYMAKYWESVADQTIAFAKKYELAGVDIDWEYPANAEDWQNYNKFITRLDEGLKADNPDAILSAALSAWGLGMSKETLARFDQIQFMAYDGNDEDGYQSSLQQAEEGLADFIKNGADISKINIGIAAYGRPTNLAPYWAVWRNLETADYYNNKYYSVPDADQIYDGTFCSPALAGDKTAFALLSGAGGVMVFRVGCDKLMDDPNSVALGIENSLKRYVTNW